MKKRVFGLRMNKEQIISQIKARILCEYTKHKRIDWAESAARKIYSSHLKIEVKE